MSFLHLSIKKKSGFCLTRSPHAFPQAPDQHISKSISILGDVLTPREWNEAYQRGSGKPLPGVPAFAAKALIAVNSHTKAL